MNQRQIYILSWRPKIIDGCIMTEFFEDYGLARQEHSLLKQNGFWATLEPHNCTKSAHF